MNEPWQCPACKIWYAPHVMGCECEHRKQKPPVPSPLEYLQSWTEGDPIRYLQDCGSTDPSTVCKSMHCMRCAQLRATP